MLVALPKNTVWTRDKWKSERGDDNKGLAKVNVGGALDKFHEAYKKAKEAKDKNDELATTAIDAVVKTLLDYIIELEKLVGKQTDNVVKAQLQKALTASQSLKGVAATLKVEVGNVAEQSKLRRKALIQGYTNELKLIDSTVTDLFRTNPPNKTQLATAELQKYSVVSRNIDGDESVALGVKHELKALRESVYNSLKSVLPK